MKDRKKPTAHREGTLIKLLDLIQEFETLNYNDNFYDDNGNITPEYQTKLIKTMRELHQFNITEIGDLYLTSSGRIVLDKGYGEYFDESDTKLFTLKELTTGMSKADFITKLTQNLVNNNETTK